MPALEAHLEMIVIDEIQQIFFIIHLACGMILRIANNEVVPKKISDAARLRNSILVALFSCVHLLIQLRTATFNTKMTTPTTVRIKLVTERLENSFLCGTIVDTSSIWDVVDSKVTFSSHRFILKEERVNRLRVDLLWMHSRKIAVGLSLSQVEVQCRGWWW